MESKSRKRGPYLKWSENTKIPRQTLWSRSGKKTSKKDEENSENTLHSLPKEEYDFMNKTDKPECDNSPNVHKSVCTGDESESCAPLSSDADEEWNVTDVHLTQENVLEASDGEEVPVDDNGLCSDAHQTYADSDPSTSDEDTDGESENDNQDRKDNFPIYAGSRITVATSMLLILTFALRHGLTGNAIHDLLSLIELHCLSDNLCQSTVKLFRHFASQVKKPVCHYFCGNCGNFFAQEEVKVCSLCTSKDIRHFITVPIAAQLGSILSRPNVSSTLQKRSQRKRSSSTHIRDVYDGELYKATFGQDGYFRSATSEEKRSQLHLSLQINTDGVSIFRTSRYGIWPIYGIINELPPSIRFHKDNRLFMGLWFGEDKPQMNVFFTPLVKELNDLYHKGTDINNKTCRVIIMSSVADAPARSLMMNSMQFNGNFGCSCCYAQGERIRVGDSGGFSRVYPYDVSSETGHAPSRQHKETVHHGESVDADFNSTKKKTATPKFGIKGSTVLRFLPMHDIIKGMTIDYMHCVFLGITKMFLTSWFDARNRSEEWSLRKSMKVLSQRLVSIQAPNFIKRLSRPLEELAHWKASEFRSFLLFFSLPVLTGIFKEEYLAHWMLLSQAVYILSCDVITQEGLHTARTSLKLFCLKVKDLYGARYETFNTHCLLHLCDKVADLGPLWAHSCFYFEGFNGELRLLFHGTQNIQSQIMRAVCIQQAIPDMVRSLTDFSSAKLLYDKMTNRRKIASGWTKIGNAIYVVGKLIEFDLPDEIKREVLISNNTFSCFRFLRLSLNGQIIQSICYGRSRRRNNYTVVYNDYAFGHIMYYLKLSYDKYHVRFLAVVKKLHLQPSPPSSICKNSKHLVVKESDELDIIPIDSITGMCFYAKIADEDVRYVVKCPNTYEID